MYPKAKYKHGSAFIWDGVDVDMLVVNDEHEDAAAEDDGWRDQIERAKPTIGRAGNYPQDDKAPEIVSEIKTARRGRPRKED